MSKGVIILLVLIMTVGFFLRFNNLSERSLWTDEFFTLFESSGQGLDINNFLGYISGPKELKLMKAQDFKPFIKVNPKKSLKDVSRSLLETDTHPPLYFWIMHGWMDIFKDSALALRFFSLLMGLLSIPLAYYAGIYLFSKKAALFSAIFLAISAFSVRYSQEARAYSLIMVLTLASCIFLLRFEKYARNKDAFLFAVFSSLGLYTHYFYSFILFSQFIYFSIIHAQETPKIRRFYLAFLGALLFFSPWFIRVFLRGYNFRNAEWIFGYPGLADKVYDILSGFSRYLLIFDKPAVPQHALLLIIILFFIYFVFSALKNMIKYPRQVLFCLLISLVPILSMLIIDILQHGALIKQERFWMFSFAGFVLLSGYFLSRSFLKNKPAVIIFILIMLSCSVTVSRIQFGPAPKYASMWINKESRGFSSAVIVYNIRSVEFAQSYYLDNGIYLVPVRDNEELYGILKRISGYVDKIFIVRHFHRTDPSLMDQSFMDTGEIGNGFKLKDTVNKDDISVSEYVKCAF